MLTSGPAVVFGFRRRESQEEQDEEKSESELPEQYHSIISLLGSCSSTIGDTRMKDSIGQAGEKEEAKQRTDPPSEISLSDQQRTRAESMSGSSSSSSILGFERGRVYPERDVDERDPDLFEQVYLGGASSTLIIGTSTSAFRIRADLGDCDAEVTEQKDFTEKILKELKPLDQQQHDVEASFSSAGVPSSSSLSGPGKRSNKEQHESKLLEQVYVGAAASPGHIRNTSSGFGIRIDIGEFEAEVAEQKIFNEKHSIVFKSSDLQRDEVLGFAAEVAEQNFFNEKQSMVFKSSDLQPDEVLGFTGNPPSRSVLIIGRRKSEGDAMETPRPDEKYLRVKRLISCPIFGLQAIDRGKQQVAVDEGEPESVSEPKMNSISSGANSAVVGVRAKQPRRKLDEEDGSRTSSSMELKAMALPEELVEKILSMIPFPEILKTRVLNKLWNVNFSAMPEALVFQNQVKAVSSRWKHYCPIILNIEKEWLVAYDREYNRWQNMPLGFEREGLRNWFSTQKLRGAGSLMCGVFNRSNVFVTNIVTRTWKWLPSRPDMAYPKEIHLLPIGSDAYQVLLITKNERDPTEVACQLYDSRVESWSIKQSTVSTALFNSSSAYVDGVLYVMEYDPDDYHDVMKMLSYNVKDGIWTNIHHPFGSMLHEIETYELLVCQNHVMVVLHLHPTWWTNNKSHNTVRNTLMVYKLDPVSLEIRELARGPPEPMSASCTLFASDNHSIYFGNPQVVGSSVVELNLESKEWSCLPPPTCADGSFKNKWATFSFQPGMNPFVSV